MSILNTVKTNFQKQGILTQLIIINASVFLTVNLIANLAHLPFLYEYLALPLGGNRFLFRFWTLFTYMFTHLDFWHLFWNMFLLYFMSQVMFTILGQGKLLYVYAMSGICGGALMLVLGLLFPSSFPSSILLGASAAVLGVGATMAVFSPDYRVLLWGIIDMPFKYFYLLVFAVSTIIDLSVNTGGKISHIGGAAFGLAYGYSLKKGNLFKGLSFPRRSRLRIVKDEAPSAKYYGSSDEARMNALLDKISKSGYESLSKTEKDELFRLSRKK
jgi:membrane associated rhomboid family serine protease